MALGARPLVGSPREAWPPFRGGILDTIDMATNDPYYAPEIPDHVPPSLVHDVNVYDPRNEGLDNFHSVRKLLEDGVPDLFWTRNNGGHWVVQGEFVTEVLRDPQHFSSKRTLVPDEQNFDVPFFVPLMADPPDHGEFRQLVAPLFSRSRIASLQGGIRELTEQLIDEFQGRGECEFMSDFALQMPIVVFLQLLDLPLSDRAKLLEIAARVIQPPAEDEQRPDVMQEVFGYLQPTLEERSSEPGQDVLSQLVSGTREGRALTMDEMLGLSATILIGGLDTVAGSLGFFARFLADNPDARKRLIEESGLLPTAVEELLRRFPVVTGGRVLTEDHEFHGVLMKSGDHVSWTAGMFNFDDRQFPHPMEADFDRPRAAHMTLGQGIHTCAGAFLARSELTIFLETWLARIPDFRVKAGAAVEFRPGITVAYRELPLVWDPQRERSV